MQRILTDEHLEKLAKVFVYHTYGEPEPSNVQEPRLSFESYLEAWMNGEDFTADLRAVQNHIPKSETNRKTVAFPVSSKVLNHSSSVTKVHTPVTEEDPLRPVTKVALHP